MDDKRKVKGNKGKAKEKQRKIKGITTKNYWTINEKQWKRKEKQREDEKGGGKWSKEKEHNRTWYLGFGWDFAGAPSSLRVVSTRRPT